MSEFGGRKAHAGTSALAIVVFCTVFACSPQRSLRQDVAGDPAGVDEFPGKVVYLDFWASWCEPCERSFPWMSTMHERFESQGLVILAVNVDRDPEQARSFLAQHEPPFRVRFDAAGELAGAYHIDGMPSAFVYDRHGELRESYVGFRETDTARLEALITSLLEEGAE